MDAATSAGRHHRLAADVVTATRPQPYTFDAAGNFVIGDLGDFAITRDEHTRRTATRTRPLTDVISDRHGPSIGGMRLPSWDIDWWAGG